MSVGFTNAVINGAIKLKLNKSTKLEIKNINIKKNK